MAWSAGSDKIKITFHDCLTQISSRGPMVTPSLVKGVAPYGGQFVWTLPKFINVMFCVCVCVCRPRSVVRGPMVINIAATSMYSDASLRF